MKAILFDFGGTLDTNGVHWSEKFWEVYQRCGVPISKQEYERAYVAAEPRMNTGVVRRGDGFSATLACQVAFQWEALRSAGAALPGDPSLPERIARICFQDVQRTVHRFLPLLHACAVRYALGVVSNFYGNIEAACRELMLDSCFRSFTDSAILGVAKPDPALFRHALAALNVEPEETYVIGDSYDRDIVPAKALGCVTIWLRGRSWREPNEISKADYIITSLDEVRPLLRLQ